MFGEIGQDWGENNLSHELLAVSDADSDQFLEDLEHLVDCQLVALLDAKEKSCLDWGVSHWSVAPLEVVFEHFVLDEWSDDVSKLLSETEAW